MVAWNAKLIMRYVKDEAAASRVTFCDGAGSRRVPKSREGVEPLSVSVHPFTLSRAQIPVMSFLRADQLTRGGIRGERTRWSSTSAKFWPCWTQQRWQLGPSAFAIVRFCSPQLSGGDFRGRQPFRPRPRLFSGGAAGYAAPSFSDGRAYRYVITDGPYHAPLSGKVAQSPLVPFRHFDIRMCRKRQAFTRRVADCTNSALQAACRWSV